jgi:hypothetical protein
MKVYNYNPNNKVYTYAEEADPDPLVPGRWLIPANATTVEPVRPARENELLIFNEDDQVWNIIEKPVSVIPYNILRAQAYPSIFDYIDGVVKNDHKQIDKYIRACKAVKKKYPKPKK